MISLALLHVMGQTKSHDQFTTKKAIKFELQSNRWKILKNNVFIDGKTHVECYNPGLCSLYRQW